MMGWSEGALIFAGWSTSMDGIFVWDRQRYSPSADAPVSEARDHNANSQER